VPDTIDWTPKARAALRAAEELFYERGIHAVGVDAVAERAGITKKTLYDRFGSKERLVVEYLADRDRRWQEHLDARLEAAGQDPAAQATAVFAAARDWARERGAKGCAMVNAHAEISDPAHPAYPVIVGQKRRMLDLFTRLAADAGCAAPGEVGAQIMLLHEGAVVTAGMAAVEDPFTRALAAALRILRADGAATSPADA
jgi:AcrR family transcriptional regulator